VNAIQQAQSAYRSHTRPLKTTRSIEYDAFAHVTHRLKQGINVRADAQRELISALHDNRRLWTILAADVVGDGNDLPLDLRARILSLAQFTNDYSSRVLNGASPDPLIDITTAIMRGLRGTGGQHEAHVQ